MKDWNPTPKVNASHGAPMGRPSDSLEGFSGRLLLRRIPLEYDYDPGGVYWGEGQPLYAWRALDGSLSGFVRAQDREFAMAMIQEDAPGATFYKSRPARRYHWYSSNGLFGLEGVSLETAKDGCPSGADAEGPIRILMKEHPHIASQVMAWPADAVRAELGEYGAWDDGELADDEMNLVRMLWLAFGSILDEANEKES